MITKAFRWIVRSLHNRHDCTLEMMTLLLRIHVRTIVQVAPQSYRGSKGADTDFAVECCGMLPIITVCRQRNTTCSYTLPLLGDFHQAWRAALLSPGRYVVQARCHSSR